MTRRSDLLEPVAPSEQERGAIKHLDQVSDDEITGMNVPTGIPLVYELDADLKPIKHYYLGDEEAVKAAMDAVKNQGKAK